MQVDPRPRTRRPYSEEQRAKIATILDRRVDARGDDDCWPWTGPRLPAGYGTLKINIGGQQHTVYAHRAAFDRAQGYLPKVVRHTCDNPPCCNPRHLLGGFQADNARDMMERGRANHAHGSAHFKAKLTDEEVVEIRWASGKHKDIALRYGIDTSSVTRIKAGEVWKHIPGELPPRDPNYRRGMNNARAKVTPEMAAEIFADPGRQIDIAARLGVSQTTVSKIKRSEHWLTRQSV